MKTLAFVSRKLALASTATWLAAPSLHAQSAWPADRPIKLIVPFAPGGSANGITRQIAEELRSRIGEAVVAALPNDSVKLPATLKSLLASSPSGSVTK